MESKQLTRKLNSIFWWTLSVLPLLLLLGFIIACIVNLNSQGGTSLSINDITNYWGNLDIDGMLDMSVLANLKYLIPSFLTNGIENILSTFGVGDPYLAVILSWFVSIQCYHLLIDVLLFVVRWCHDLMERGAK